MSICLLHRTLASICHGPHCPACGAPDDGRHPCIGFVRRDRSTAP